MPSPYSQEGMELAAVGQLCPNPLVATSSGGAQANNCTLTPPSDQTAYVTGFEITGLGANAASTVTVTLTGLTAGNTTFTYIIEVPTGVTVAITPLIVEFPVPIPGQKAGQAIALNVPSFGTGNTQAAVNLHGFAA